MKKIVFAFLLSCICLNTYSQERKNYKPLLRELNKMLKNAEEFSWMYQPDFVIVEAL